MRLGAFVAPKQFSTRRCLVAIVASSATKFSDYCSGRVY